MTIEDFLDRLEGVRPAGSGYVAECPAHEDRNASLSVGEGEDGRILLNCHAGCTESGPKPVLDALELQPRDLFLSSGNFNEPEKTYSYTDENGDELYQAVRFPGKQFRQRHWDPESADAKDGWVKNLDGVRRVIYRLPEVLQAIRDGRGVWIVEGEKDVESLRAIGKVATCNPMGAMKWREDYSVFLTGANVTIIADRDETGRAHAQKVKTMLEGYALNVRILQAREGKDATDHLEAGLGPDEFVPIRQGPRRGVVTAVQLAEAGMEELHKNELDSPGYQFFPDLPIVGRQGRMYAIGAYTSDGKTTFASQFTRNLSGTLGLKGGYYTLEMPEKDIRNKMLQHHGIPLAMLEQPWLLRQNPDLLAKYQAGCEEIADWNLDVIFDTKVNASFIVQTSVDREHEYIVVDHIHRFGWGGDRGRLEQSIQELNNLAIENNIVVILLCQVRKTVRDKNSPAFPPPTLQEFRETSVIGDDSAMALALYRQREAGRFTGVTQLEILKNRYTTGKHDEQGTIYFPKFDLATQTYTFKGGSHGAVNVADTPGNAAPEQTDGGELDYGSLYD